MKKLILAAVVILSLAACKPSAPEPGAGLAMPTLGGQVYDFSAASRARPVVIASMAGFCRYCKMMAPLLDKLAAEYKGKDVDFILAFVDEKPEGIQEIAKNLGIQNAKVAYNGGDFAMTMGVEGFPAIYLVQGDNIEEWGGYAPSHIDEIRARLNTMI